ncbi:MAG TPA: DUF4410 domain-containing protein [Rhizomicrobium sp.]|jgi:hypothetical protein|nr:DUF4410 domain-containing protein [Rhizomicrobium sp.]
MKRLLAIAAVAVLLAGCAGSVSAPEPITALSPAQKSALRISDITADAAPDVQMSDGDFGLIAQNVRSYIGAKSPQVFADQNGALKMRIHFTKFDRGNAFARSMLIGLGQIVIEANVSLLDPGGKVVAEYKVSKDFALGGMMGAMTTVEDVEDGFAKSVAEVVK